MTSFELRIPVDGFARMTGSSVSGVFVFITTAFGPDAEIDTPVSRNAGFPARLTRRLSDQTTSAEVSGVPSPKCAFFFRLNVNDVAFLLTVQLDTSSGIGVVRLPPLYVNKVS